jgi:3-dehydroquinate synthase
VNTIKINLAQKSYAVYIGKGLLQNVGASVCSVLKRTPTLCVLVTSRRVRKHWGKTVVDSLRKANLQYRTIVVKDDETQKTLQNVEQILKMMAKCGADRASVVLALGGGVIGDMAGFAASIYMRGIPVVQLPTTLLAQVDASIGGKTGVDVTTGKNVIGTFHQPVLVLADINTLNTLKPRDYRAGIYEIIKCAIIRSPKLFTLLETRNGAILKLNSEVLAQIITSTVRIKAKIVMSDEREGGLRRILNFGHTIGHAIEAATGYKHFLHGEAVALGMVAAIEIAEQTGHLDTVSKARMMDLVDSYGALPTLSLSRDNILSLIKKDKKTVGGITHFVLPTRIGDCVIHNDVPLDVVNQAITHIRFRKVTPSN